MPDVFATGSATVTFTTPPATAARHRMAAGWTADESRRCTFRIRTRAAASVVSPPAVPPTDQFVTYQRNSVLWPDPTLNARAEPTNWNLNSVPAIHESWGRHQIMVGGFDLTFYRGVQTLAEELTWAEPFGPATCRLKFPQITPFEDLSDFWLYDWADVAIWQVDDDNQRVGTAPIWTGIQVSYEDVEEAEESHLVLQCIGTLFQADFFRKPPEFFDEQYDIGHKIADILNDKCGNYSLRTLFTAKVTTGVMSRNRGSWNPLLTGYIQELLAIATTNDGDDQWTLDLQGVRTPVLRLKDRTTVHWRAMAGAPGVSVRLSRDLSQVPTTYYGEGIDPENCRWRGSRYPNLRADDAPVFPGDVIGTIGETGSHVRTWKAEMSRNGWSMSMGSPATYTSNDEKQCRRFQASAGITVDGDVGPQTWAATFETGSNAGDLRGAFFLPLLTDWTVNPFLYAANGAITGYNPIYNDRKPRIETYQNFGERITMAQAIASIEDQYNRDRAVEGWAGELQLDTDPQEGCRFDIRAGQNIMVRKHRGVDRLLHIAGVRADYDSLSVTLQVDERARDLLTLTEILKRNRDAVDPTRRSTEYFRQSRQIEDRIAVWDCESGSGIVPYHATYAGLWNVLRIPMAEVGTVIRSEFQLDNPDRMVVALFDRSIFANTLARYGSPLAVGFWDQIDTTALGCVIAWGDSDQPGGYSPGLASNDDPLTGLLRDDGSWHYQSTAPPWMWVAIYVAGDAASVNYIQGRLYPGFDG